MKAMLFRFTDLYRWIAPLILTLLFAVSLRAADAPLVIPFQGQVTNQAGIVAPSGQYSLIFNLYDVAVGGQPLWTERHSKVGVINGGVNVFLGSITPLDAVDFSQTRYLGITVDTDDKPTTPDPEMVPRQMIIPAFWAKRADNATKLAGKDWSAVMVDGASGAPTNDPSTGVVPTARLRDASVTNAKLATNSVQNGQIQDSAVTGSKIADGTINVSDLSTALQQASVIPPGTIMAYGGFADGVSAPPAGWLFCDGSALNGSKPEYAALRQVIRQFWGNGTGSGPGSAFGPIASGPDATDFNLPDLRGWFLRGVNGAASQDPGDGRGNLLPGGSTGNNVGSFQDQQIMAHAHSYYDTLIPFTKATAEGGDAGWNRLGSQIQRHDNTGSFGGSETRPKNAYVNYIIKL